VTGVAIEVVGLSTKTVSGELVSKINGNYWDVLKP